MSADELLDLVNDHDQVIGTIWRSDAFARGVKHTRGVNAFLVNRQGELWIPKRAMHKARWPGHLDMSVGGAVEQGESYEAAFQRETREELNIDIDTLPWREVGYFSPLDTGLSSFQRIYEVRSDAEPDHNRDDFSGGEWVAPRALLARIDAGEPAKGDLCELLELIYLKEAAWSN